MKRLRTWKIKHEGGLTARYRPAGEPAVLLAHGAGVGQDAPFMVGIRDGLARSGISVMTFNYPYMEKAIRENRRSAPNRMPILLEAHRAALDRLTREHSRIVLAGKSMGGRMSTHLASTGLGDGVLVFGYPLVAFGKGEPRDTSHFDDIQVPALFVQGTRDKLAPLELLRPAVARLSHGEIHEIADADHSYRVPKRTGRTSDEVIAEVVNASVAWAKER